MVFNKLKFQNMRKSIIVLLLMLFTSTGLFAQVFTLSGEFRPRLELRHGYRTLPPVDADMAAFVSQRSRLNMMYESKILNVFASVQEVRTWGGKGMFEVEPGLGFHQAYAEIPFLNYFSLKIGRQELRYNNQRLFGINNWNQNGRTHDAAIFKFMNDGWSVHLGTAFNQSRENIFGTYYDGSEYKSLNYLWIDKKIGDVNLNGMAVIDGYQSVLLSSKTYFRSTFGGIVNWKLNKHALELHAYRQGGKNPDSQKINAWYLNIVARFNPVNEFNLAIGSEVFSGNDQKKPEDRYRVFNPLYGGVHLYNGHLDYFADIPKSTKNAGLINPYLNVAYAIDSKKIVKADYHLFALNGNVLDSKGDPIKKYLGSELDLTFQLTFSKAIDLQVGYSTMFASKSMEYLKPLGSSEEPVHWGWIMLTVKPLFFVNK